MDLWVASLEEMINDSGTLEENVAGGIARLYFVRQRGRRLQAPIFSVPLCPCDLAYLWDTISGCHLRLSGTQFSEAAIDKRRRVERYSTWVDHRFDG